MELRNSKLDLEEKKRATKERELKLMSKQNTTQTDAIKARLKVAELEKML